MGVEVLHNPQSIGSVGGGVVKLRHPHHLQTLLVNHRPQVLLTRPESEGYDYGSMRDGVDAWFTAVFNANMVGIHWYHEIANEPNHNREVHKEDPTQWFVQARALLRDTSVPHTHLLLPGLQPHVGTAAWAEAYDSLQREFPRVGRAGHIYFQGASNILGGISEGLNQMSHKPGWITEFNDSGFDTTQVRVHNCVAMLDHLESQPNILGAVLFSHETWVDEAGVQFGYSIDHQRYIINSVVQTQAPPPVERPPTMDRFTKYPQGPGIESAMRARGDVPTGREWYPTPDVAIAFGEQAQYVYDKETNTVRVLPFE